jgi:ParB-like chromosome segregation protein Spo0J
MNTRKSVPADLDARTVPAGDQQVAMKTVLADPDFQVRNALDESAIKQMMITLRGGGALPPIRIIRVKGVPYLADGWHRYQAHSRLSKQTIAANVADGTVSDLRRVALQANLIHGVRLTRAARDSCASSTKIRQKFHGLDE